MSKTKMIVIAVAAAIGLIIILQNTESVQTNILFMKIIMPRAILLLITLVLGGAIGAVSTYWVLRKKSKKTAAGGSVYGTFNKD